MDQKIKTKSFLDKKRINIGCGKDIRKGWINLDSHKKMGADVVFDLNSIYKKKKFPFKEEYFDYVYCSHVLEDFSDPTPIIDEMIRITKKGGIIEIRVPHETNAWSSIYHKRAFNLVTLRGLSSDDYGNKRPITLKSEFYGNYGIPSKIIAFFLNLIPVFIFYGTPIKYLFPSTNIRFLIKKAA